VKAYVSGEEECHPHGLFGRRWGVRNLLVADINVDSFQVNGRGLSTNVFTTTLFFGKSSALPDILKIYDYAQMES
jgi:hypothetical protein